MDTAQNVLSKINESIRTPSSGETPQQSSKLDDFLGADDDFLLPKLGFQASPAKNAQNSDSRRSVITSTIAILSRSVSLPSRHSP
jgi:hypothetical protein